jgi:hypothetical protein
MFFCFFFKQVHTIYLYIYIFIKEKKIKRREKSLKRGGFMYNNQQKRVFFF